MKKLFMLFVLMVFVLSVIGCSKENIAGEAHYASKADYIQQYTNSKYIKTEMNYINKISNVEQKKMLTSTLNIQKELASGEYIKKYPNLRIDGKTGELKKKVVMNDGSTQEFVLMNYQDLKTEFERQQKYTKKYKQWPEMTQLVNEVMVRKISMDKKPKINSLDTSSRISSEIYRSDHSDWSDTIEIGGNTYGKNIEIDSEGNSYVVGKGFGTYQDYTSYGSYDAILVKYDPKGNRRWIQFFGGSHHDSFEDIVMDNQNNLFVLADIDSPSNSLNIDLDYNVIKFDRNGRMLTNLPLGDAIEYRRLYIDESNNLYLVGEKEESQTLKVPVIIKYNSRLQQQWMREIRDEFTSVNIFNAYFHGENAYFIGSVEDMNEENGLGKNPFIINYNTNGSKMWSKSIGLEGDIRLNHMEILENEIYLLGSKEIFKFYYAKLDLNGNFILDNLVTSQGRYSMIPKGIFQNNGLIHAVIKNNDYYIHTISKNGELSEPIGKINFDYHPRYIKVIDSIFYGTGYYRNNNYDILKSSAEKVNYAPFKYNKDFKKSDFSKNGLMYYADELYEEKVFPFWPYLTPVKSQIGGSCMLYSNVAAEEIIHMTRPDLSEINELFFRDCVGEFNFRLGAPLGSEEEWPFIPHPCNDGYKVTTEGAVIPCSQEGHQGIPVGNPINVGDFSEFDAYCDEINPGNPNACCKKYRPYAEVLRSDHGRCVIISPGYGLIYGISNPDQRIDIVRRALTELKYPLVFSSGLGNCWDTIDGGGFLPNNCASEGGSHAMALIGYISKENIPLEIKNANLENFDPNENYFIVKNSWGKGFADGGFAYMPSSYWNNGNADWPFAFKYDINSEVYSGCDSTRTEGVGE
jgi:hypothetical protein